jgi:hypothetical protein
LQPFATTAIYILRGINVFSFVIRAGVGFATVASSAQQPLPMFDILNLNRPAEDIKNIISPLEQLFLTNRIHFKQETYFYC